MNSSEPSSETDNTLPKWVLWLLAFLLIAWPMLSYWMSNHYSGWSRLHQYYAATDHVLNNSQGRTNVSVISAGRRYNFESSGIGKTSYARTEVGVDEGGFWIRGVYGGWTGGPRGAIYVPWDRVKACSGSRVMLIIPDITLVIHDQQLLDQCAKHL